MMNHTNKEIRKRRLKRWRDKGLENVAWIVVYAIAVYLFFWTPLARSMGW